LSRIERVVTKGERSRFPVGSITENWTGGRKIARLSGYFATVTATGRTGASVVSLVTVHEGAVTRA
jgi:hypothetical protein